MLYTLPFKRLFLGTALALGLIASAHAADLQPLRVANQKSTIKALLEVSGETKTFPMQSSGRNSRPPRRWAKP